MKYIIWLLVIALVLIAGTAVVGRLLAPFAGLFGGTRPVAAGRDKTGMTTAEELAKAPQSVQEKARRKSWAEGNDIYAVHLTEKTVARRRIITAEVEYTPSRDPEVYWLGVSRKYSWIQIGDLTLSPLAIEGAADLDSTLKSWSDNSGGIGRSSKERLRSVPGSERLVAGRGRLVKLSFRLPNGFVGLTSGWHRLFVLGMTNQSFNNAPEFWGSPQADAQGFPTWDADLFMPATVEKK